MTDADAPGGPTEQAVDDFVAAARRLKVAPLEDVPEAFDGLDRDERRALALLMQRSRAQIAARDGNDAATDAPPPADPAPEDSKTDPDSTGNPDESPAFSESADAAIPPASDIQPEMPVTEGPSNIPKVGGLGRKPSATPPAEWISLRNGRCREQYDAPVPGFDDLTLTDDDGSGLTLDAGGTVTGKPARAGEFTLTLGARRNGRAVTLKARVSIIPDPRDLWTSTDSDRSDPYWKRDEAFARALGDGFIAAASKRGRSHAKEGAFRDDDFAIHAEGPGGWHYLMVADGAGSAALSREGSRLACETAMARLPDLVHKHIAQAPETLIPAYLADPAAVGPQIRRELLYPVLGAAALDAAKAIAEAARAQGLDPSALSTTLILAITRRFGAHWFTATFTMGDGGAAIYDDETGEVQVLCAPDSGEFAGQTRFLHESEFARAQGVLDRIFLDVRQDFTLLALMTDGITDPKFPTPRVFADPSAWHSFWREDFGPAVQVSPDNAALELQMFEWLDFWSKGNHDDRTLAVLVPPPGDPAA